jgi:hypothetical protein
MSEIQNLRLAVLQYQAAVNKQNEIIELLVVTLKNIAEIRDGAISEVIERSRGVKESVIAAGNAIESSYQDHPDPY